MKTKAQEPKMSPSPVSGADVGKPTPRKNDTDKLAENEEDYPDKLISLDEQKRSERLPPGDMPQGLEEERRGHSLDNQDEDEARSQEIPLGRDEKLHGIDDV